MSYTPENPSSDIGEDAQAWLARELRALQGEFALVREESVSWRGRWVDGTYLKNDQVVDNGWLAIANKTTFSKPAPVPLGDVRNIINTPGPPTFAANSVSSGSLVVGARYTLTDHIYIREARFYVPASAVGLRADAWLVLDPDTDPSFEVLVSSQVIDANETGKWVSLPVGLTLVQDQRKFDVVLGFVPTTGALSFTYDWNYKRSNQPPASGQIVHKSGANAHIMEVNKTDNGGTDRSTDMDKITAGSEVEMLVNGTVWRVLNIEKSGDIYKLTVSPSARAAAGVSGFMWTYYGAITINYVEALNHYNTVAEVNGFLSTSGYAPVDAPPILNQHAYGIDIQVQGVLVSGDWDFLAFSD